jgi:hypothetical protein
MLPRSARAAVNAALLAIFVLGAASCERVPLLAPTGSTITLVAQATALSSNGSTQILGQVLEASGTPPHSGTHVTFTTSLGRIEPSEVSTDVGGRVTVTFHANGSSGTATIIALSGGATTGSEGAVKIAVGTAAAGGVSLSANPAALGTSGGTTTLTAFVIDVNGNPLVGVPVTFVTTAGSLGSGLATTDAQGRAITTLTTAQKADITASVGVTSGGDAGTTVKEAKLTVNVALAPGVGISLPSGTITRGVPATFTINVSVPTGGNPIRDTVVFWGDGSSSGLGSATGAVSAAHTFENTGTFTVTGVTTDIAGFTGSASTTVVVQQGAPINISVTPSPQTTVAAPLPVQVEFTVVITAPTGIVPVSGTISYGDGLSETLGSLSGTSRQFHNYTVAGTYPVTVTVVDSSGRSYQSATQVRINN